MCVISLNGYSDTYKGLWNNGWEDWARWSNALTVRLCCSLNGLWINFSWENNYCWLHLFMRILKNSPVNLPPHTPLLPNPHLNCFVLSSPAFPFFPGWLSGLYGLQHHSERLCLCLPCGCFGLFYSRSDRFHGTICEGPWLYDIEWCQFHHTFFINQFLSNSFHIWDFFSRNLFLFCFVSTHKIRKDRYYQLYSEGLVSSRKAC